MNVIRIAMWSGPRNISSALMHSFENRSDTWVCDEPFYGFYLKISGAHHPDRQEIIDSMVCDPKSVIETLTKEVCDSLTDEQCLDRRPGRSRRSARASPARARAPSARSRPRRRTPATPATAPRPGSRTRCEGRCAEIDSLEF